MACVRWTLLAALSLSACTNDEGAPDAGRDAGSAASDAFRRDASAPPDGAMDAPASGDAGIGAREAASVFFVGHSLVNFDMPAMLADLAVAAGREYEYGAQVGIGAPLWWNWEHPDTADGDDAYLELPTGRYDVLVLTELIPIREHFTYSNTVEYAARFAELALDARPSTQVYVYETWYDHEDPAFLENIANDRTIWERIADELDARVGGPEVLLVPAGTAMARLVERMEAGEVGELTSRSQLFVDAIHLNDVGNYFVALVHFATIYR
ncbi:MAG TPA: hypothetical protein VIL20_18180, partial [Sandaracinaceae bacterium]